MPRNPYRDPATGRIISEGQAYLEHLRDIKKQKADERERRDPNAKIWQDELAFVRGILQRNTTPEEFSTIMDSIARKISVKDQTQAAWQELMKVQARLLGIEEPCSV